MCVRNCVPEVGDRAFSLVATANFKITVKLFSILFYNNRRVDIARKSSWRTAARTYIADVVVHLRRPEYNYVGASAKSRNTATTANDGHWRQQRVINTIATCGDVPSRNANISQIL